MCEYTVSIVTSWETGDEFSTTAWRFLLPVEEFVTLLEVLISLLPYANPSLCLLAERNLLPDPSRAGRERSFLHEWVGESVCLGADCLQRCLFLCQLCREAGMIRSVRLDVSGPFLPTWHFDTCFSWLLTSCADSILVWQLLENSVTAGIDWRTDLRICKALLCIRQCSAQPSYFEWGVWPYWFVSAVLIWWLETVVW